MESKPLGIFSINAVVPYNLSTNKPYGRIRVAAGSQLVPSQESVPLRGGAAKAPWALADGATNYELTIKFREYPFFLDELMLAKKATEIAAEANGFVGTLTNKKGSLVAATGLASASAISGSENDLKFLRLLVEAFSATQVNVYSLLSADFSRGTLGSFKNDLGLLNDSPLTITMGGDTNLAGYGVKLTGGASAIAMNPGDTAVVDVRPKNLGASETIIGNPADTSLEFGLVLESEKVDGVITYLDIFRVKGYGVPLSFDEKAWSEAEYKPVPLYDESKGGVFKKTTVRGL